LINFLSPLVVSFLAALSGAVVPGPVFIVTVSESLKKGSSAGPLIVVGHLILEVFIIAAIFLGLDVALSSYEAKLWIAYLGGAMLVAMGSYLIKTARSFKLNLNPNSNAYFISHGLIAAGILCSGSNPHFFLWWLTIGLPTIQYSITVAGTIGFIAFLIGHAAADLLWFGFVSYATHGGKKFLNERAVQLVISGSAFFLVIFGISYIYLAYTSLI